MPLLSNDPHTQLAFSVYENKGVFALLLGSGLSRAAEIPTGWEVTLDLIRRVALAQGEPEQTDWAKWYREKTGHEPNYSTLLEALSMSADERRSILHRYIEPSDEDRVEGRKVPTKAHLAIADLVRAGYIRVIITTNFDRLMENALRERGVEPTIVASADALAGAEPVIHSTCYILKLHGDYKDARILNTDAELSAYPPDYDQLLDRIFDEHGLIIAGWSGEWDHALRAAFLRAPNRRYPVYWAARGTLGAGAEELVAHRRARVIPVADADSFFTGLQQRIESLQQSQRPNPLSVDLLVASTKRFLARPEHRIQLDELFTDQADRLMVQIDRPEFTPNGKWSPDEFRHRVQLYESMTEPLARMTGVLGRWGDGSETPLVLDIIRALYGHAEKVRNGLTVWIGLRSYPAVMIFLAYGIGLTRAQRWAALHQLFSATLAREDRAPRRVVETLFLWGWKGSRTEFWQELEGFANRKTPLSDHCYDVFGDWGKSFVGLMQDFEVLFDRFEMLAALAYLEATPESELEQALASPQGFVRMPIGRLGLFGSSRERLVQEMKTEATRNAFLQAGFGVGSEKFTELFIVNLERYSDWMSWH